MTGMGHPLYAAFRLRTDSAQQKMTSEVAGATTQKSLSHHGLHEMQKNYAAPSPAVSFHHVNHFLK